jgi:hypothetical protein
VEKHGHVASLSPAAGRSETIPIQSGFATFAPVINLRGNKSYVFEISRHTPIPCPTVLASMPRYQSGRLEFRAVVQSDRDDVFRWMCDPDVATNQTLRFVV